MYKNLNDFLNDLRRHGEMITIQQPVSTHLQISRLTDEQSKSPGGGKALFFEKVIGSDFPVVTNIFGSSRRICMALGVSNLDELAGRIREYIQMDPPANLREALRLIPTAWEMTRFFPRTYRGSKKPPCQEVVLMGDAVDLSRLPVLHCWPKDAGPFVTLPLVFTRSMETGKQNAGMYRLQVYDQNTTGMHWHIHKDGSHYFNEYRRVKKRMPVAVAVGADPAVVYAATAPMPRGVDEMILAGFIRKKPVVMTRCLTVDLKVPAEAEFVLEGYVDPDELRREGPFGDHTGYYSLADDYPVFHVTAITHRRNPVYAATLVGRPPMEDCYLAKATERLFLPLLQAVMPEIRDYHFPWEGVFHNIVLVSMEKEYPGHAQKLMSGLWGQGQMSFCKAVVTVDEGIRPQDGQKIIEKLVRDFDPASDVTLVQGVLDVLDHSAPSANFGSKIGIDLTRRASGEPPARRTEKLQKAPLREAVENILRSEIPETVNFRHLFSEIKEPVNRFLAISVSKKDHQAGRDIAQRLLNVKALDAFNIFILYDQNIDLSDGSLMLWKLFNNVDPRRDILIRDDRAAVDACIKGPADGHNRLWPDEMNFDAG